MRHLLTVSKSENAVGRSGDCRLGLPEFAVESLLVSTSEKPSENFTAARPSCLQLVRSRTLKLKAAERAAPLTVSKSENAADRRIESLQAGLQLRCRSVRNV